MIFCVRVGSFPLLEVVLLPFTESNVTEIAARHLWQLPVTNILVCHSVSVNQAMSLGQMPASIYDALLIEQPRWLNSPIIIY